MHPSFLETPLIFAMNTLEEISTNPTTRNPKGFLEQRPESVSATCIFVYQNFVDPYKQMHPRLESHQECVC
jgi:hypothetical protein